MAEKLFNKDIADKLAEEFGITKKLAAQEVDFVTKSIIDILKDGNSVTLKDVGKLEVVTKKPRTCMNPKTKEKIQVPARKAIAFKVAKALKDDVK